MKLKQRPEDFRVEEESRLDAGTTGAFCLYRLSKSGIGTPEAVRRVAKRWRLPRRALSVSGLKDTHGQTGQMLSVRGGRAENLDCGAFKLNYLGRVERPADGSCLIGNRFRIVVRDFDAGQAERFAARAAALAETGFPDFYDDQRFGSLRGTGGRFIARSLIDDDFETALRLAVASPDKQDRSAVRRRRVLLRDRWGEWEALAAELGESYERTLAQSLAAGDSYETAYGTLDRELRRLHLSAFQAQLFNECLRRSLAPGPEWEGAAGAYRFPDTLPDDERIPLASAQAEPHPLLDAVLAEAGVERAQLAHLPFRSGSRSLISLPTAVRVSEPETDPLNRGRFAVALAFTLRPGSYATMLVKRCAHDLRSGTTQA